MPRQSMTCCAPPPRHLDFVVVGPHDSVMAPSSASPGTRGDDARDGQDWGGTPYSTGWFAANRPSGSTTARSRVSRSQRSTPYADRVETGVSAKLR